MNYVLSVAIVTGLYVSLSVSFNVVFGYGGLLSIAHPVFFGVGAYASGILAVRTGMPVVVAIVVAVGVAAVSSLALSLASLRISGDYLLIASLGLMLAVIEVVDNLEVTGGAGGLTAIPPLVSGPGRALTMLAIVWSLALLVVLVTRAAVRSDYGRAIAAMRDDEGAFVGLGRDARAIKTVLFSVGSSIAGLCGALYGHYFQYFSSEQMGLRTAVLLLTMVVVGGAGTVWGPVVGAVALQVIPQLLTFIRLQPAVASALEGIAMSVIVLAFLFLRPAGIVSARSRRRPRRSRPALGEAQKATAASGEGAA